jgi:hypothetical protein
LSDTLNSRSGSGYLTRLLLAIAILIMASNVIETILSRSLFSYVSASQPGPNTFDLYNLTLAFYSLCYLVVFFLVFYFMGRRPGISIGRDWLLSLEYLFIGGLLGETLGLLATAGVTTVIYGDQFGIGPYNSVADWLYTIIGFVRNGGEQALIAFAGLVVASFYGSTAKGSAAEARELMVESDVETSQPNSVR